MALVSAHTIPTLLDLMAAGKLDASAMITHGMFACYKLWLVTDHGGVDFKFTQIEEAYDTFSRAAETKSLKVNIEFE